jgi:hypothetical protein
MAITIISKPLTNQMPAYNPLIFEVDSNQKNQPGFRYIIELFNMFTGSKITEFRIAPTPSNGRGYIDISKVISNLVDKSLQFQSIYNATTSSLINYSIRFGEEFQTNWNFNDYIFNAGGVALTTDSAFGAGFSNQTHPFQVGDQIYIRMNLTYNDPRDNINGFFTVTEVISNKTIKINLPWSSVVSGPASPGKITYADGRKSRLLNLENLGAKDGPLQAFNMALDIDEYKELVDSTTWKWQLTGPTRELLTNQPVEYTMHLNQFAYMHAYDNNTNNAFYVYVENDQGEVFRKIISTGSTSLVRGFGIGPSNLGVMIPMIGTLPVIKSNTKSYKFWTTNGSDVQTSQKYQINIDRRCLIEPIQVLFMDRKGSWSSFMFDLRQKRNITTDKKSYRKEFGRFQTGSPTGHFTFDKTDQGLINYHSRAQVMTELNTNWLDDVQNKYFEELLTSPYTFVNFGDGQWKACIVQDGQFQTELQRNKRLIRRTISIIPAIEDPINI